MDILQKIDEAIMERVSKKESRQYMGASGLGEPCDAKLWYSYKHPKNVDDPRIHRIFDLGHSLEETLVGYFKDAGLALHTQQENGEQFGFEDGIIAGHVDGFLEYNDEYYLVEFKSFNAKRFEAFKKLGVKESDPKYNTQVQVYMGKFDLEKCIFVGICKNTCALHLEIVNYDPIEHHWAINRGKQIGVKNERPDRKYGHKSNFNCKQCSYRTECWAEAD